jgi:hypothetical protein
LAIMSCHIPKPYESITRYYGWYSCRARGERAKAKPPPSEATRLEEPTATPSVSWATCPPTQRLRRGPPPTGKSRRSFSGVGHEAHFRDRSLGVPTLQRTDENPRLPHR